MFDKECLQALNSLRLNNDISINKSDKNSGVVMDKSDYIFKMEKFLHDTTKFEFIGPSCDYDNTAKVESKIQHRLQQLNKDVLLPPSVYEAI